MNVDAILQFLRNLDFSKAVWLFPPGYALHVLEESTQFTAWVHRYISPRFTHHDPLARAVIGGLAVSTVLTLIILPFVYSLFDDAAAWARLVWLE